MTYPEAVARLRNHAGLPDTAGGEAESLQYGLYRAEVAQARPPIEALVSDVLQCLVAVNFELNGPIPSDTIGRVNPAVFNDVLYAVNGIIVDGLLAHRKWQRDGLLTPADREALYVGVVRIAYVWNQVIAGDIDDLLEDLEHLEPI